MFRDKLADDEDIQKFDALILSTMHSDWGVDLREHITDSYYVTSGAGVVSLNVGLLERVK